MRERVVGSGDDRVGALTSTEMGSREARVHPPTEAKDGT